MHKHVILALLLALTVNACSSFQQTQQQSFPLLLLPPNEGPSAAVYKQTLTLQAKGQKKQLLVVLKIDSKDVKLRVLSATGQSLYTLSYDGITLSEINNFESSLPSKEMLSMLQFAMWPSQTLVKYYKPANYLALEITPEYRLVSYNGKRILQVSYVSPTTLMLENYVHFYEVNIETLEVKKL